MARVALIRLGLHLALDEILIVVEVAVVGGDAEIVAHVLAAQPLLAGHQGLIELLPVTCADDVRARVAEELLYALRQVTDGAGIGFLDEEIAGVGVGKGEFHQLHRLVQVHQEAGHGGVRDRDGLTCPDLVDEQRDHATAGAHDVAVARAADDWPAALGRNTGVGGDDVLHHGLGDTHGVDGVGRLVRGQAYHALHARLNGGVEHVVRALHVGLDRLHRKELAARHLLERRSVPYVVHAGHRVTHGARVAHVADVELDLGRVVRKLCLELVAHIVLLFLVAGEDADLADVGGQEMLQNGGAEGACPAGDEEGGVGKCRHKNNLYPIHIIVYASFDAY